MDDITFHHDTVLSDVHMHKPCTRHLMTHLNTTGQPVFMSRFRILAERPYKDEPGEGLGKEEKDGDPGEDKQDSREEDESEGANVEPCLDEDGDLNITHRPRNPSADRDLVCAVILQQFSTELEQEEEGNMDDEEGLCSKDILRIEHTMATPLEDVGKQVWRGALLLADFILSKPDLFRESTVLDLGAGTGLTSIVMTTTAKTVYCTDVGEDLLNLCRRNVSLNKHLMKSAGGKVEVRHLDWLQRGLCTDADVEFSWTEEDIADLHDNTSFIIAADVCYDDDLTDGLFRTLHRLCSSFSHSCTVFISIEKRFNFTLGHMDVSCDAYNHFKHRLFQLKDMEDGCCRFKVERLPSNFPQRLVYERVEQLELWQLSASPLSLEKAKSSSRPDASVL